MSIEIAPPVAKAVTPAKTPSAKETAATKEKSSTPDKPQNEAAVGFMAILASLDNTAPIALPVADIALPRDDSSIAVDASTNLTATELNGALPADAATLLAQALQWAAPQTNVSADTRGSDGDSGKLLGAAGSKSGVLPKGVSALTLDVGLDTTQKGIGLGSPSKGAKGQLDTAALQSMSSAGTTTTVLDTRLAEGRDAKFVQTELTAKMAASVGESIAPITLNFAKREEQNVVHGLFKTNPTHEVPGVANASAWLGGATGASATATTDAAVVAPSYIAEQVSYWISNDVQKAEMKLDGLGDKPVEVSISMSGNQAHVAFRTDEVQARDALENASLQLKEMLQRDGVVLSGMSVGTSAGGDAGAGGSQDRNARQGSRQVVAVVDQPTLTDRVVGNKNAAGRALDLFV